MARQGTYFLGRIHKGGDLTDQIIAESIVNPVTIKSRKNAWTFIESQEYEDFVYGKIVKFKPLGELTIVDDEDKKEKKIEESNLQVASSPFVYIPAYSGISFLRISSHIHEDNFGKYFSKIINDTNEKSLRNCEVELITDLKTFAKRLTRLESIEKIWAKVNPPNPLYGVLWENLKDYLEKRNTDRLSVNENSAEDSSLNSELRTHISGVLSQSEDSPYVPEGGVDITDAAILMAADGYGNGRVEGVEDDKYVKIWTSETIRNFTYDREPEPEELYNMAVQEFIDINDERHLDH